MKTLKPIIAFIVLTVLVILCQSQAVLLLTHLNNAYMSIMQVLAHVFAAGQWGSLIQQSLAILVLPLFLAIVVMLIQGITQKKWQFPQTVFWPAWLVVVLTMLLSK